MIWEVDDDCDKGVTWTEFQAMFSRCRNDKTGAPGACAPWRRTRQPCDRACSAGYEPRRLYNVAEFLMNDKDNSGKVSVEEVMQILFLRYGRQLLDSVRACSAVHRPALRRALTQLRARGVAQQLEEIFGTSDTNSGTRDLSLTEFLTSLNMSQAKQLRAKAASTNPRSAGAKPAARPSAPAAAAPTKRK